MDRRSILASVAAAAGGLFAAASSSGRAKAATPDKTKVVYHLCDLDKVEFVLGNIKNHYEGAGGPDKVTIALVVHGPALKAFHTASAHPPVVKRVGEFTKAGLAIAVCGNTMKAQKVTLADLLPGITAVDQGGVVRIAELQAEGYVYLRP